MGIEDLVICPARITLDAAQLAFFSGLPTEAPSVQSELGCELEQGHEGSHAALGQQVERLRDQPVHLVSGAPGARHAEPRRQELHPLRRASRQEFVCQAPLTTVLNRFS